MKCIRVPRGKGLNHSICTVFILILVLPVVTFAATNSIRMPNSRFSAARSTAQMFITGGSLGTNNSGASPLAGAVISPPTIPSPLLRSSAAATLGLGAAAGPKAGQLVVVSPILNINFTCPTVEKTGMAAVGVSDSDIWNNYEHRLAGWQQDYSLTSDGKVTVTKFGHSATRARNDNCSTLQ